MAQINEQFILVKTRANFEARLQAGDIKDTSIAFIEDTSEIWAKGKFYPCPYTKEELDKKVSNGIDSLRTELEQLITNLQTSLDNHKADKDKKHIPEGGHERLLLAWAAEGEAKWEDISNMFTGLEEILAYGVEWDITVADPHITRIGNMSLHKSLPIQSLLKGCIAQGDKVIYWLSDNDWRWRKEPVTQEVTLAISDSTYTLTADIFSTKLYEKLWVRINEIACQIDSIATDTKIATLVTNDNLTEAGLSAGAITIELGSVLNGYDGTVRVYCPNFYIKSYSIENKRRVWLSTVRVDNTWTYQHEILLDAYRSTILNEVPENMGYLSTLPVNSAISVVNTNNYCRGGGNRAGSDTHLSTDQFKTDLGKPRTSISRASMRTYARNAGSEMLSYDQYKNIFYWLYVVEYANFNCQETFNNTLTSDGYKQGGLGNGITNMGNWGEYNGTYPLTPCGYGNELGNFTGVKDLVIPEFTYPRTSIRFNSWSANSAVCTSSNGADNSKVITEVKTADNYAFYHNPDNVWGTTTYHISGLTEGLKVIFKEKQSGNNYTDAVIIKEVTQDGEVTINWGDYNKNGLKYVGFSMVQANCNIKIYNSNVNTETMTVKAQTLKMPRWRGFDNPFGDIWTNLEGIIIDADADNHSDNMNYVFTCQDPSKYADKLGDGYEKVGEEIHQDGYTKLFDLGDAAHIFPKVMGGNTTQYKCDYHWTGSKETTPRTVLVGGRAATGAYAGLGSFDSRNGVSSSWADVGFRSVSSFLSFSLNKKSVRQ